MHWSWFQPILCFCISANAMLSHFGWCIIFVQSAEICWIDVIGHLYMLGLAMLLDILTEWVAFPRCWLHCLLKSQAMAAMALFSASSCIIPCYLPFMLWPVDFIWQNYIAATTFCGCLTLNAHMLDSTIVKQSINYNEDVLIYCFYC